MDHADHVALIREGVPSSGGRWADFGSGRGAFTLALAELLGPGAEIYSIDKDLQALNVQQRMLATQFPLVSVHYLQANFSRPINLPALDGVVMANALHFIRDKEHVLEVIKGYLKPGGRLVLVEYNSDHGNLWVPYPLSYQTWEKLARRIGLTGARQLSYRPGRFMNGIYSALSFTNPG